MSEFQPQVPASLASICSRAMAKQPGERYRNATELATALEQFQTHAVLVKPASRLVTVVVHAVSLFAASVTILLVGGLVNRLPAFENLGTGAYPVIVFGVLGALWVEVPRK